MCIVCFFSRCAESLEKEKALFSIFLYEKQAAVFSEELADFFLAIHADVLYLTGDFSDREIEVFYRNLEKYYPHFLIQDRSILFSRYEMVDREFSSELIEFEIIDEDSVIGHLYFAKEKNIDTQKIKRKMKKKDVPHLFSKVALKAEERFILLNRSSYRPYLVEVIEIPVFEEEGFLARVKLSKAPDPILYPKGEIFLCEEN